ncbi:hypothetical protein [Albibacterium indicum]|uniref:hypothetical protein n=1 Tax=Albibacterium indicum TaxID=2292082 RepID=UPI000E4D21C9|nr:hypothetical protein [Pedobacter indicus]
MKKENRYITPNQYTKLLGVTNYYVYRHIKESKIKSKKVPNGRVKALYPSLGRVSSYTVNKVDNFYEAQLGKVFGNGSMWKHRTFRTIFDPISSK